MSLVVCLRFAIAFQYSNAFLYIWKFWKRFSYLNVSPLLAVYYITNRFVRCQNIKPNSAYFAFLFIEISKVVINDDKTVCSFHGLNERNLPFSVLVALFSQLVGSACYGHAFSISIVTFLIFKSLTIITKITGLHFWWFQCCNDGWILRWPFVVSSSLRLNADDLGYIPFICETFLKMWYQRRGHWDLEVRSFPR